MADQAVHPLRVAVQDRDEAWAAYREARAGDRWYEIQVKGKAQDTADVYLMDEIGFWGTTAKQFVNEIKGLQVKTINLHVNSPGGDYHDSKAIMNALRNHDAKVTATVDGLAASGASIVILGADEVVMNKGAELMIHDPLGGVLGNAADFQEAADLLNKFGDTIAALYADKAGGDVADWRAAMRKETWYNGQEAVDAGLADRLAQDSSEGDVISAKAKFDLAVYTFAGRDKAPAPQRPADPPAEGDPHMAKLTESLVAWAKEIGVDEPEKLADDKALQAAITAKLQTPAPPANDPKDDDPKDEPKPVSLKGLPANAVVVDRGMLADLQKAAKRSEDIAARFEAKERDAYLDQAVHDGKLPVASKPAWAASWDKDPEGIKAQIDAMPKGLVPVAQIGDDRAGSDGEYDADYAALYPQEVR